MCRAAAATVRRGAAPGASRCTGGGEGAGAGGSCVRPRPPLNTQHAPRYTSSLRPHKLVAQGLIH